MDSLVSSARLTTQEGGAAGTLSNWQQVIGGWLYTHMYKGLLKHDCRRERSTVTHLCVKCRQVCAHSDISYEICYNLFSPTHADTHRDTQVE